MARMPVKPTKRRAAPKKATKKVAAKKAPAPPLPPPPPPPPKRRGGMPKGAVPKRRAPVPAAAEPVLEEAEGLQVPVGITQRRREGTAPEVYMSIGQLATECSSTRETVSRKLDKANIKAEVMRGAHGVFRLRDALKALYGIGGSTTEDPEEIADPFRRHMLAKARLMEAQLAEKKSQLVPIDEVIAESARVAKLISQMLDALPDVLEMQCALKPDAIAAVERMIDKLRKNLADGVEEEVAAEVASETERMAA